MSSDEKTPVLSFLGRLSNTNDKPSTDGALRQIADYFDASGIGAWCVNSSTTVIARSYGDAITPEYPWQADPALVERLRKTLSAFVVPTGTGNWLVTLVWEPGHGVPLLAWLFRTAKGPWRDSDTDLWPLVAQTLVRFLAQQGEPLLPHAGALQRLENVAQVTSRLSHDFGNYLTGILGFTELSIAQAPEEGVLNRYLQEVLQSARQGSDWIRRLHLFCRRHGQFSWPTELSSVLEEARLQSGAGTSVRWEKRVPADLPLLAMDAASLQAMLLELVNNSSEAAQSAQKTCTLTFSARAVEVTDADCRTILGRLRPGKFVEITVTDDGPGFGAEAGRIFTENFFSTKPRHRGLGFLVVYGILYRFCGGLRIGGADDQSKGARIDLYVPAAPVESVAVAEQDAPHVLVVHPDPLLFESLRKILEWQGYRVTVALTAQAALSAYLSPEPHFALVLAEALLPQLSGFDLARRILDRDTKANFMFLYTQSSFHGLAEEEMLKRFPLLRWPVETTAFVRAVRTALARTNPGKNPESIS